MPPRKSTDSVTPAPRPSTGTNGDTSLTKPTSARKEATSGGIGVEDLALPRSMVQRLAKGVLPANTQVQKDALLALSKSATVFVSYLANSANDRAVLANKKTIQPKDVLEALAELEFEGFVGRCEAELTKYNTIQCTKRNDYRRRIKDASNPNDSSMTADADADALDTSVTASMLANLANGGGNDVDMDGAGRDYDGEPVAKKMRMGANGTNGHGGEDADETELDGEDAEEEEEEEDEDESAEEDDDVDGEVQEEVEDALDGDERRLGREDEEESGNESG